MSKTPYGKRQGGRQRNNSIYVRHGMKERWNADEAISRWDKRAAELTRSYTSQGDRHREVLLNPVLLELIGPVEGKRILDAGCGEGYLSRILAKAGASVVAVDYSRKMLEIARDRTQKNLDISYKHGNMGNLSFLKDMWFDIVVSNMVLGDLPRHERAIAEANRVLAPNGIFIFSIPHPCFSTPACGWVKNEEGEKLYWKVDRYFEEVAIELPYHPAYPQWEGILQYHRTLTSYFRAVVESGFIVEALVEPSPQKEMLAKYPEFIHVFRMCHFLVFKARKRAI